MEKPTGVIQKIIESLQQINALDTYSPIEKDIILHNLRAAYMIFLNIKPEEQNEENRVEKLFEDKLENGEMENEEWRMENEEMENEECDDEQSPSKFEEVPVVAEQNRSKGQSSLYETSNESDIEIEEPIIEAGTLEEETEVEVFEEETEEDAIEEESAEEETEEETLEDETLEEEAPLVEVPAIEEFVDAEPISEPLFTEAPLVAQEVVLQDDILEFIPDAKPQDNLLFDETSIPKSEKKSLNDLLTEKKDDNSLGARFQQASIPDLTKAIGINEKFAFIRELFHSNGVDFSNAIQKLNECENIDNAFILMEELKHLYLWDTTSSAYLSLCDLVRRRFIQ